MLGIAYFLQGIMTGKNWVKNLAFGWWIGPIIMFIFPGFYSSILAVLTVSEHYDFRGAAATISQAKLHRKPSKWRNEPHPVGRRARRQTCTQPQRAAVLSEHDTKQEVKPARLSTN